jgi:hypothetical protein
MLFEQRDALCESFRSNWVMFDQNGCGEHVESDRRIRSKPSAAQNSVDDALQESKISPCSSKGQASRYCEEVIMSKSTC